MAKRAAGLDLRRSGIGFGAWCCEARRISLDTWIDTWP